LELGPRRKGSKAVRKRSHERSKVSVLVSSEKEIEKKEVERRRRGEGRRRSSPFWIPTTPLIGLDSSMKTVPIEKIWTPLPDM